MAIEKKGKTDFLRNVEAAKIAPEKDTEKKVEAKAEAKAAQKPVAENKAKEQKKADKKEAKKASKKKEAKNGRPRKLLIEGVKEKSITVQLPKPLIKALKKLAKKDKKSMKEVIGKALLEKYGELIKD